jgi:TolB protein
VPRRKTTRLAVATAVVALATLTFSGALRSQERPPAGTPVINIKGTGRPKIPIALPPFEGGDTPKGREAAATLHDVLRDDLLFSNYFALVPEEYYKTVAPFVDRKASYNEWSGIGAEAVLIGKARPDAGDDLLFEGRVYDMSDERVGLGKGYRGGADQLRLLAHRMSDEIVQHYTSNRGIAMTRIAYVAQVDRAREVFVMDYDGARGKKVTANGSINRSPVWSPDGKMIAFVSLRSGSPRLMLINSDGILKIAFPQSGELNGAPAWSPDGNLVAFSSGRDGNAEIYTLRVSDATLTRLTRHDAIDTSPAWSPDGRSIAFTSDRGGSPQIYVMDADGGSVRRLPVDLSYSDAPSWSIGPNEAIAFTARVPGGFDIYSYEMKSGALNRLTTGAGINEYPRWSPDGRHLVFASNRSGAMDIYTMDANGDHVRRLTKGGNNTYPAWSN